MKTIRNRAKEQLPMVLLTLLSIVQALALELLWSHVRNSSDLYEFSSLAVLLWVQIIANFLGIVLIWIIYASSVMRFRWVPTTSDSVFPFVIGLFEFMLIAALGPDTLGWWFLLMGLIFAMMISISHVTMRRARADQENEAFFSKLAPAKLKDFYPGILVVSGLWLAGFYMLRSGNTGWPAMLAMIAANACLIWQLYQAAKYWNRSLGEDQEQ